MWNIYKKGFKAYLTLEKSLSDNSVDAYQHDVEKFTQFLSFSHPEIAPGQVELKHFEKFLSMD